MNIGKIVRRFLVPSPLVTVIYLVKYGCKVSPKAEVELSSLLRIGKHSEIASFAKIKASDGPLEIGQNTNIGPGCFISASKGGVYIGDYCLISPNVSIIGNNYKYNRLDVPISQQEKTSKGIKIGNGVWLGAGVAILDGTIIGDGVIVAPNSVVSGKIPGNVIVQGNPAKVIFTRR